MAQSHSSTSTTSNNPEAKVEITKDTKSQESTYYSQLTDLIFYKVLASKFHEQLLSDKSENSKQLTQIKKKVWSDKSKHLRQITDLAKDITDLTQHITLLKAQNDVLKLMTEITEEKSPLAEKLAAMYQQLNNTTEVTLSLITQLNSQTSSYNQQITKLKKQLASKDKTIADLTQKIKTDKRPAETEKSAPRASKKAKKIKKAGAEEKQPENQPSVTLAQLSTSPLNSTHHLTSQDEDLLSGNVSSSASITATNSGHGFFDLPFRAPPDISLLYTSPPLTPTNASSDNLDLDSEAMSFLNPNF